MAKSHGTDGADKPVWQRLAWFAVLWAAGAGLLWVISLIIRWAVVPD